MPCTQKDSGSKPIGAVTAYYTNLQNSLKAFRPLLRFRFGVYAAAGETTCGNRAGTLYHERSDAAQFKAWGVDCEYFIATRLRSIDRSFSSSTVRLTALSWSCLAGLLVALQTRRPQVR